MLFAYSVQYRCFPITAIREMRNVVGWFPPQEDSSLPVSASYVTVTAPDPAKRA